MLYNIVTINSKIRPMKAVFYSIIIFMLLTSSTCRKAQLNAGMEKQLIGEWKYAGKSGGYAGKHEKADPAVNNALQFKKGLIYIIKVNDKATEQGTFVLYKTKSIYSGKEDNAIRFEAKSANPSNKGSIITLRNDTLTIADNFYDGFKSEYIRTR